MQQETRNNERQKPLVDVRGLIASKNPRLLRLIPPFIIRYLRRIIHEQKVNDVLHRLEKVQGLEFVSEVLKEFGAIIRVEGSEHIPREGKAIIVANHPLGGLDGMALMHVVGQVRQDLVFPVNDLLMNVPNLQGFFIPINKHGSNAANVRVFDETFASDKLLLYFPAGLCSRKQGGQILDLDWKKGVFTRARRYQRDVIPAHISGKNSAFFYNLANLRKRAGIGTNIEMLYLVDEMVKQKNQEIVITFGKAIPYTIFDRSLKDVEWAALVREHTYKLAEDKDVEFHPNVKAKEE